MEMFSKSQIFKLILISLTFESQTYAVDVVPQGQLVNQYPKISKKPTVQMYFDPDKPPVLNVTPGRPTVVQFPNEVRSCIKGNAILDVTYADKVSQENVVGSSGSTGGNDTWYSAVVVNLNSEVVTKFGRDLLKIPPTAITCAIRISSPDSKRIDSYTWVTIGIKVAPPESTYYVVYLLNNDTQNQLGLPGEEELQNQPYIDVGKLSENIKVEENKNNQNKQDESKKSVKSEQKKSILNDFDFKNVRGKIDL